mmetsp:Transcript_32639/g.52566  ORF Transcript_32639/g.52566 Transcript_32639/m.52566 type:complete len:168 (-) Transcript_32639:82-585(-)
MGGWVAMVLGAFFYAGLPQPLGLRQPQSLFRIPSSTSPPDDSKSFTHISRLRGGGMRSKARRQRRKDNLKKQAFVRRKVIYKKKARKQVIRQQKRASIRKAHPKIDTEGTLYARKKRNKRVTGPPRPIDMGVTVFGPSGERYGEECFTRERRLKRKSINKPKRRMPI